MVAVLVETPVPVEDRLVAYVQEGIDDGEELRAASDRALRRIVAEGAGNELLTTQGAVLAMYLWRHRVRHERAAWTEEVEASAPTGPAFDGAAYRASRDQVFRASLLDMECYIAGRWRKIGDLTRVDCELASNDYQKRAAGNAAWTRFYSAVAAELKPDQKVRDRYDDAALLALRHSVETKSGA